MDDDAILLRRFADEHSETAFRELVERRIGLVYGAALRQLGGDTHLAQEVTQGVFLDLARKARSLADRPAVTGWLYTSVRFAAGKALRSRVRRLNHETEAQAMEEIFFTPSPGEIDWNALRPMLDTAMHELGERDREAILLRYFEGRSLSEVGAAIGLEENTARMRVTRALEKLRSRLARRGITSTAAALSAVLATQPAVAVPAGLVTSTAGAGVAMLTVGGGGAATIALSTLNFMNWTKVTLGTAAAIAAVSVGTWMVARAPTHAEPARPIATTASADPSAVALRAENDRLRAELARSRASVGPSASASTAASGTSSRTAAIDALRVVTDLQRRKLVVPEVKLMSEDAKISDEFTELFGLTSDEQATLQQSIDAARLRLKALGRENTKLSRAPNGDVIVAVKAYPEAGGATYDAMLKTFAETLGAERYSAFLALGADQTEKALGRFGIAQQMITFSRDSGALGEVSYRINQRSNVTARDNSNYQSLPLTPDQFAREAGSMMDLELSPADFFPRK